MGGLTFAAPFLLAGLLLLPLLWLILRRTPPPPLAARLPTLVLLGEEEVPPERAARPPWLLLLFRLLLVALVVIGLAGPEWRKAPDRAAPDRLLIVIDNGWAAAPRWPEMVAAAEARIDALSPAGTQFAILATAPILDAEQEPPTYLDGEAALRILSTLAPQPWRADRGKAAGNRPAFDSAIWISDGYEGHGSDELRESLSGAELLAFPSRTPVFLAADVTREGYAGRLAAPSDYATPSIRIEAANGRTLDRLSLPDPDILSFRLPVSRDHRRDAARLTVGEGAAATTLLAGPQLRPRLLLIESADGRPPLESGAFYIRRAATPVADVTTSTLADAEWDQGDLIVIDDVPASGESAAPVLARVRDGAVLIAFAGPRTAENGTELSPVRLRRGARAFGGTLTWQEPMPITAYRDDSPLSGLPLDPEAVVRRQALTDPPDAETEVWAELSDGTPLVTAKPLGEGLLVLVHTAASPDWSDLPLSGLFAPMIDRFARIAALPGGADIAGDGPWRLERQLDGFGRLVDPYEAVEIDSSQFSAARASPETPPGLYRNGDLSRALNVASALPADFSFAPLETGGLRAAEEAQPATAIGPWLLAAAAVLFILDMLVALALRRRLPAIPRGTIPAAAAIAALLLAAPVLAQAAPPEPALQLGYIAGTAAEEEVRAGLTGLSRTLSQRTAVAVGEPAAVRPGDDDLGRYPFLYWPAYARGAMSPAEAENIRAYLSRGGLILFDFGRPLGGGTDARALLDGLALPPLAEVGPDHVAMKSYYLIRRSQGGALWMDAGTEGDSGRVSSVAIGGGGWARLWGNAAVGAPSEREAALRFGINLVMYALTGTYKADQVHTETLLDRIGRGGTE
ncbi:MAG: DUF4159 domain-containing protein [Pacificimonas sp.]|jgi:hypothetical protein|nr:DUF4159 domain-containing protein [Pacificimonas sp.]